MNQQKTFSSDSEAQMIILIGFVTAIVIISLGGVIYSLASSSPHSVSHQSNEAHDHFLNIRDEYGKILMYSSGMGNRPPFDDNNTVIAEFESNMKASMASHGYILDFTWGAYYNDTLPTAEVTIRFFDGKNSFNDTITYNLVTGSILYDVIPPGNITTLDAVSGSSYGEIILTWIDVGDDGYTGIASKYDLRYSLTPITNMSDFDNATILNIPLSPMINGTPRFWNMSFDPGWYYFAIIVYDEVLQASNLSNLPPPVKASIVYDTTPPFITDISVDPNPQSIHNPVSVSANITDNYLVNTAYINITFPNGTSTDNLSMTKNSGHLWYYNYMPLIEGLYDFTIYANDTSDYWNSSTDNFEINSVNYGSETNIYLTSAFYNGINRTEVFIKDDIFADINVDNSNSDDSRKFYLNFTDNLINGTIITMFSKNVNEDPVGIYNLSDTTGLIPLGIFDVTSTTGEWINVTLTNISTPTKTIWFGEGSGTGTHPREQFDYIYATIT